MEGKHGRISQQEKPIVFPPADTIYEQIRKENTEILNTITVQPLYSTELPYAHLLEQHEEKRGVNDYRRPALKPQTDIHSKNKSAA